MTDNSDLERQKACFEQNAESVRSLNQIMWQVPVIAMTLTGGLWFGVVSTVNLPTIGRNGLLLFAALVDLCLIVVIWRVRFVMQGYIDKLREFYPGGAPNTYQSGPEFLRDKIVVKIFSALLGIAAVMSLLAVFYLPTHQDSKASKTNNHVFLGQPYSQVNSSERTVSGNRFQ